MAVTQEQVDPGDYWAEAWMDAVVAGEPWWLRASMKCKLWWEQVEAFLAYFHSLGALLWFDDPTLRETVILDLQWLLDAVGCIVRDFNIHTKEVDVEAQRARLRTERESLLSAGYPAEDPLVRDLDRLIAAAE